MSESKMFTPRGFETWNRALQGAYRKGYEVGAAGVARDAAESPGETPVERRPVGTACAGHARPVGPL